MEVLGTIIIYIGLAWLVSELVYVAYHLKSKVLRCVVWGFALVLPSLVAAFRGPTGTDSLMYQKSYENIHAVSRWSDFEIGYVWLVKFLNRYHLSYHALFFFMELLTILFFLIFLNNEKKYINIKIAVFLFMISLYLSSFNMMRQALAITMVLYAFSIFMDEKYLKSIVIILLACLFHKSALLGCAVVGGKLLFQSRYAKVIMVACFSVIVYFLYHRELLGEIVHFIIRNKYYVGYITRDVEGEGTIAGYCAKRMPVIIITLLYVLKNKENKRFLVYFGMMTGGYLIGILGVITATQVQRIGEYFIYLNIILFAYCANYDLVLYRIKIGKKITQFLIVFYILIIFYYDFVHKGFSDVIPYRGIF